MSTIALDTRVRFPAVTDNGLNVATRAWFVVTVIGQWLFFYYIVAFYGRSTLQGNFELWNRNKFLFKGFVAGDTIGNLAFAAHVLLAATMAFGGAMQLVPWIRARAMAFHRWNGRVFLVTAFGLSVSGLHMVLIRRSNPSTLGTIATALDALLILIFGSLALRTAMTRNIAAHRQWALRTYLVANGQWFIRIGVMAWAVITHGWRINTFFLIWNFGSYLVPLAILELYFIAKNNDSVAARRAVASLLLVVTLLSVVGTFGFTAFVFTKILNRL
jgi:hypothetical protein